MFCSNCGNKTRPQANFCGKCGKSLSDNESSTQSYFKNDDFSMSGNTISFDTSSNKNSVLKSNYLEIMKTFFTGMLFVGIGSFIGINFIPYSLLKVINILFIVFMIASVFFLKSDIIKDKTSLNIYCSVLGIILGVTFLFYFNTLGGSIFFSCVLGTGIIFAISYNYALNSPDEDIFNMGPILYKLMLTLFVFELINVFFFDFGTMDLVLSVAGILIYSGFILYTMKNLQTISSYSLLNEQEIVSISLSLIVSFLNLLLDLLRLIYIIKSDD